MHCTDFVHPNPEFFIQTLCQSGEVVELKPSKPSNHYMELKPPNETVCYPILHVLSKFCTTCSGILMHQPELGMMVTQPGRELTNFTARKQKAVLPSILLFITQQQQKRRKYYSDCPKFVKFPRHLFYVSAFQF